MPSFNLRSLSLTILLLVTTQTWGGEFSRAAICEWLLSGPYAVGLGARLREPGRTKALERRLAAQPGRNFKWTEVVHLVRYYRDLHDAEGVWRWTKLFAAHVDRAQLPNESRAALISLLNLFTKNPGSREFKLLKGIAIDHVRGVVQALASGVMGFGEIYPEPASPLRDLKLLRLVLKGPLDPLWREYVSVLIPAAEVLDWYGETFDRDWKRRRRPRQSVLAFASALDLADDPSQIRGPIDVAFAAQAAVWTSILALIKTDTGAAAEGLLQLEPSPAAAHAFEEFALAQEARQIPLRLTLEFARRWKFVNSRAAEWIARTRGAEEPLLNGIYNARIAPADANVVYTELHFFMQHELARARFLARTGRSSLKARAVRIVLGFSDRADALHNPHPVWRDREPFLTAGFTDANADWETEFTPLDFKVDALLSLGQELPDYAETLLVEALKLFRQRRPSLSLYQLAVTLRLSGELLSRGHLDASRTLQEQARTALMGFKQNQFASPRERTRAVEAEWLRAYLEWNLDVRWALHYDEQTLAVWAARRAHALVDEPVKPSPQTLIASLPILAARASGLQNLIETVAQTLGQEILRRPMIEASRGTSALLRADLPAGVKDACLVDILRANDLGRMDDVGLAGYLRVGLPLLIEMYRHAADLPRTYVEVGRQLKALRQRQAGPMPAALAGQIWEALSSPSPKIFSRMAQ